MITVTINGVQRQYDGDPSMPLLWYLRDELGMTGTKYGCGADLCGACTVHMGGVAVKSCNLEMSSVSGQTITTIEGLDAEGNHPVQKAWRELGVPQCGYCQAGQIMTAAALLSSTKNPTDEQIRSAMEGNICRCGCYQRIVDAIRYTASGV
jgi:isoquinoline 1-oxidoreductase alpha subunit